MTERASEQHNDKGVCRTSLAIPGPLNTIFGGTLLILVLVESRVCSTNSIVRFSVTDLWPFSRIFEKLSRPNGYS